VYKLQFFTFIYCNCYVKALLTNATEVRNTEIFLFKSRNVAGRRERAA